MIFQIRPYTIVLLVAPNGSCEDKWVNICEEKIKDTFGVSSLVVHGEQENIEELLLKNTTYPNGKEFIFITGNNFDKEKRENFIKLANNVNYEISLVYFNFNKNTLLELDKEEKYSHKVFRQNVLENLDKKKYKRNFEVTALHDKYFSKLDIQFMNADIYKKTKRVCDDNTNYIFIGDIHESVDALNDLLSNVSHIENKQLVFVGDLFDKGKDTVKMLDLVEKLSDEGAIFLEGNHESYLTKRLLGKILVSDIEAEYFTALEVFLNNEELKNRFLAFHSKCYPFLRLGKYNNEGEFIDEVYVSHAPVKEKYMHKVDSSSLRQQRNYSFGDRGRDENFIRTELSFMETEASYDKPLHIFGHIAHNMENVNYLNKYWLDTGAVHGNKLTALCYKSGECELVSVETKKLNETNLFTGFKKRKLSI